MTFFACWFQKVADIQKNDTLFISINHEIELSIFFPFTNQIYFQKKKNSIPYYQKNVKNYSCEIKKAELKLFTHVNIFFSFDKIKLDSKLIFNLLKNSTVMRMAFFLSKTKNLEEFISSSEGCSTNRINFFMKFFSKKKLYKSRFVKKSRNRNFSILRISKRKSLPKIFLLPWDCFLSYFFRQKTRIIGKLIRTKLLSRILQDVTIHVRPILWPNYIYGILWCDILQRINEEWGFLTLKISRLGFDELIFLINNL